MNDSSEIDDSLYSRQLYVLGDGAMQRMAKSSVLVSGLGGLGVEIAKNIILAGVKVVAIHDTVCAEYTDLGTQFYLREEDVKIRRNRAEACSSYLAELNPYVSVQTLTNSFDDLSFIKDFQCIVLVDAPLSLQLRINHFCRQQNPPIKFISGNVMGVFSSSFCDFGAEFEVHDTNGEEPKEVMIASVTKAHSAVVTCLDNRMHGFETGNKVTFKEVKGMTSLNGSVQTIQVLSPFAFSIGDTSGNEFGVYQDGGFAKQIKMPVVVKFESLQNQLVQPDVVISDFGKFEAPMQLHLGFWALHTFHELNGRYPNVRDLTDATQVIKIAQDLNTKLKEKVVEVDQVLLTQMSFTARGSFSPLSASLGGFLAQEILKALTGKFSPLKQFLYLDAVEVLKNQEEEDQLSFLPRDDRYDALRICIGEDLCRKLASLKLFMVGCGAIGCELLKNYAMLGIGSDKEGMVTITDNDLIEKSNLNRQFLFRPHHIQKPKSVTAAASAKEINPGLNIDAHQHKVCPETEESLYTDEFFQDKHIVVNALDNVEARRYVDSRCVSNQRSLLESGTMGPKGHIQVIVPHITESYGSQRDPADEEVPFCTLKSFPAIIEHTIQWARDKFQSSFTQKPEMFKKFWSTHKDPQILLQLLKSGEQPDGVVQVIKILRQRPNSWEMCVALARNKFEKYFNHKAKHLLRAFPLETRNSDGSLFWQSPKRPPSPVDFDSKNKLHMDFIENASRLYAFIYGISVKQEDLTWERLNSILETVKVMEYIPSSKKIEINDSSKKSEEGQSSSLVDVESCERDLSRILSGGDLSQSRLEMQQVEFEKDDDSNGHIDFITAASNLRASMYNIEAADRLKTKRIAGKIVPAIATTTAAVSGLVMIELIKVVMERPLEDFRNCFLNLALPVMVFSEPAPPERTVIKEGLSFTLWDKWEVKGHQDYTLRDFVNYFKALYGFNVSMVVQGVKMIYVPIMPGHKKRLNQVMLKLLKLPSKKNYVDLTLSFEPENPTGDFDEEDIPCPPVRYFFK